MKLRLRGDSIRLRVTRPELADLIATRKIAETTHLLAEGDGFTYVLESVEDLAATEIRHDAFSLAVRLPATVVRHWAESQQVGVYDTLSLGDRGALQVIVEKDFACLDAGDEENADAFPNPKAAC